MNFSILNGRYAPADAERLLKAIIRVKIDFHEAKIKTSHVEEDMKHSEKRINELTDQLRQTVLSIRSCTTGYIDLHGAIAVDVPTSMQ